MLLQYVTGLSSKSLIIFGISETFLSASMYHPIIMAIWAFLHIDVCHEKIQKCFCYVVFAFQFTNLETEGLYIAMCMIYKYYILLVKPQ